MKKFLRFLLIFIIVIVVAYLALCFMGPKRLDISESRLIDAPKEVVWHQIQYLKYHESWSPFKEMDSTVHMEIEGEDGKPGSAFHYTSENSGEGRVTNKGITGTEMQYHMDFIAPFKATANGIISAEDTGGQVKATWTFHQEMPFFMRGMCAMFSMKNELAKNFSRGMELLKINSEKNKAQMMADISGITETQFPGRTYAAIRKTISIYEMEKFYNESMAKLGQAAGTRVNGPASGLYYTWDMKNNQTDMAPALPVSDTTPAAGVNIITVPASKAYMIIHKGGYSGSFNTHMTLTNFLEKKAIKHKLVVEEYIVGPQQEQDSTKWVTNIYYLVP